MRRAVKDWKVQNNIKGSVGKGDKHLREEMKRVRQQAKRAHRGLLGAPKK
ncbi:unnamed protein product [Ectocarpus sp. 12 AP-2014]